jgi:hypothetical protein
MASWRTRGTSQPPRRSTSLLPTTSNEAVRVRKLNGQLGCARAVHNFCTTALMTSGRSGIRAPLLTRPITRYIYGLLGGRYGPGEPLRPHPVAACHPGDPHGYGALRSMEGESAAPQVRAPRCQFDLDLFGLPRPGAISAHPDIEDLGIGWGPDARPARQVRVLDCSGPWDEPCDQRAGLLPPAVRPGCCPSQSTLSVKEANYQLRRPWRDARVADSDGLENRCGCKPTVGSNPTPSAQV